MNIQHGKSIRENERSLFNVAMYAPYPNHVTAADIVNW